MTKIIFFACFLCLMLCGCFWNSDYSAPRTFDLDPGGKTAVMLPCQVSFAIIRNISGADRRFFERHAGNRMVSDEFNRWSQDPELMLERFFRSRIHGEGAKVVRVSCVIRTFEVDTAGRQVRLAVDFTLACDGIRRSFSCDVQEKLPDDTADRSTAVAAAMNKCASAVAGQLEKNISEIIKSLPDGSTAGKD